jgi:NAD(P)-dependent dehydrogenase (short-subunit alcohol dehydrogenase family)
MTARRILITGGSRGLGRLLALHLAERGHEVHLLGRTAIGSLDPDLRSAVSGCYAADFTDRAALDGQLLQAAAREPPFDVLIAGAAIRPDHRALLMHSADELRAVIDVNLAAPLVIARALLPPMIRRGYGRVIMIGSRAAWRGSPNEAAYGASKAGLVSVVESLSREVDGRRVTVNAICPERFTTATGAATAASGRVVGIVLGRVDRLIASTDHGRVLTAASWRHRLVDAGRQLARAAHLVSPGG